MRKVPSISGYEILIPLFSGHLWEATLNKCFSSRFYCVCGVLVYKVEKSNILMLLQTNWDLELKDSSKSFEFLNIHIWLKPLQNLGKKGLVEHLVILVSSTVLEDHKTHLSLKEQTKSRLICDYRWFSLLIVW